MCVLLYNWCSSVEVLLFEMEPKNKETQKKLEEVKVIFCGEAADQD